MFFFFVSRFVSKQAKKFGGEGGEEGAPAKPKPVGKLSGSGSDMDDNVAGSSEEDSDVEGHEVRVFHVKMSPFFNHTMIAGRAAVFKCKDWHLPILC